MAEDTQHGVDTEREHTSYPADVKLTKKQVNALEDGAVLMLDHQACGQAIRLWKEPQEGEKPNRDDPACTTPQEGDSA